MNEKNQKTPKTQKAFNIVLPQEPIKDAANRFFTGTGTAADSYKQVTATTAMTAETAKTVGKRPARMSIYLETGHKEFLSEAAYRKRVSINQYINDLIAADRQRGGAADGE